MVAAAIALGLLVAVVVWIVRDGGSGRDRATPPTTTTVRPPQTTAPAPTTAPSTTAPPTTQPPPAFPAVRDPLSWPFAWDSIWNRPVGDRAALVPAGLEVGRGITADEDILVLEPGAPLVDVVSHSGGWNAQRSRCGTAQPSTVLVPDVPIPPSFSTDPGFLGHTPNHSAAILRADGRTVVQTQPLHRCGPGGEVVSQFVWPEADLWTGNGIEGAHGGSGMSSLGGTVRLGELVPGGAIRHALKLNINCATFCHHRPAEPDGASGFRWPAVKADSGAQDLYGGDNPALQMGSLLALPPGFDLGALQSGPGRIVARALLDYGAYVVDDTKTPTVAFTTEWSPRGRVIDEFEQRWGYALSTDDGLGCPANTDQCRWATDLELIISSLSVVDDNGPTTVGGAGIRRAPCAPPFHDGSGVAPADCTQR